MYKPPIDTNDWLMVDDYKNFNCAKVARTPQEAIDALREKRWSTLMLDNDLMAERNGTDILKQAIEERIVPQHVQLISGSFSARNNMGQLLLDQGYEKTKLGYYYPDELLPTTENVSAT